MELAEAGGTLQSTGSWGEAQVISLGSAHGREQREKGGRTHTWSGLVHKAVRTPLHNKWGLFCRPFLTARSLPLTEVGEAISKGISLSSAGAGTSSSCCHCIPQHMAENSNPMYRE